MEERVVERSLDLNQDGSVNERRRAALLKKIIRAHTQKETVGVEADWEVDEEEGTWTVTFYDE